MGTAVRRSILAASMAVVAGLPAYLVLDHLGALPPSLRDRPWPLEAVALAATVATLGHAAARRDRLAVRVSIAGSLVSIASLGILSTYARVAAHELPDASPEVPVGRPLPELSLLDERGRSFPLGALRGHPSVFLFFRGVFCPACRGQLASLAARVAPFRSSGVQVFGVSPDPPRTCAEWSRSVHLPFPLLSDEQRRLATELCDTTEHCVVVADSRGVIRWGRLNENWRAGVRPESILQFAYRSD